MPNVAWNFQSPTDYEVVAMKSRTDAQRALMGELYTAVVHHTPWGCDAVFHPASLSESSYDHDEAVPLFFCIANSTSDQNTYYNSFRYNIEKLDRKAVAQIRESILYYPDKDEDWYGRITNLYPVTATGFRKCSARIGELLKMEEDVSVNVIYAYPSIGYTGYEDVKYQLPTFWEIRFCFEHEPANQRYLPSVSCDPFQTNNTDVRWMADRIAETELWTPATLLVAKEAQVRSYELRDDFGRTSDTTEWKDGGKVSYDKLTEILGEDSARIHKQSGIQEIDPEDGIFKPYGHGGGAQ